MAGIEELPPWAVAWMIWDVRGYNDVFNIHGVDNHLDYQGRRKAEINSGKPTAIIVGAGHYPGYNGLLQLLEHQGYKIEQLESSRIGVLE